jgi:hypothetical protein
MRQLNYNRDNINAAPQPSTRKARSGQTLVEQLVKIVLDIRCSSFDPDETAELEALAFETFTPLLRRYPSAGPELTAAVMRFLIKDGCPQELAEQCCAIWSALAVM